MAESLLKATGLLDLNSHSKHDPDLDLVSLGRIVRRRRSLLLACIAIAFILGILFLAVTKRRYRADAEMQLLPENSQIFMPGSSSGDTDNALQLTVTMETYVGVLTSDTLALQVIRELNLEQIPEFGGKLASSKGAALESGLPLEETRFRREIVLRAFKNSLAVSAGSGSRLLTVSFLSTSPELAKGALSQLLRDFVRYNDRVRFKTSMNSQEWLKPQLDELKRQAEETQRIAADLQRQTGIYGTDGEHDLVLARLEKLNQEFADAELNRIVKGAVLKVLQNGKVEELSNLPGNAAQANSPGAVNGLAAVQQLRQQEASLSTRLAQLSKRFGSAYPTVVETNAELDSVRSQINTESKRLSQRAKNDYQAAVAQENGLRQELDEQKRLATQKDDVAIRYLIANREAISNRDLYEHLLEKLKEIGIVAGMHDPNIDVIDNPHVGASPASPNVLVVLGSVLGAGLILGFFAAFLRESFDRSIHDPDYLAQITGVPLLGLIPADCSAVGDSISSSTGQPNSPVIAEAFRSIRASVLRLIDRRKPNTILVTSAQDSEGKSLVVIHLAWALSQLRYKVLIVDSDLRHRGLTKALGKSTSAGLSDLLTETGKNVSGETSIVRCPGGFDLLPAGSETSTPSELLASAQSRDLLSTLLSKYDFILLDSPQVLSVSDSRILAQLADAVLLVYRGSVTARKTFAYGYHLLHEASAPLLGTIFNAVDTKAFEYQPTFEKGSRLTVETTGRRQ